MDQLDKFVVALIFKMFEKRAKLKQNRQNITDGNNYRRSL